MSARALFVFGGWEGHTPAECVDLFAPLLEKRNVICERAESLDVFADADRLKSFDVIVPVWTFGELTEGQERGIVEAVRSGVGIAGWHGGMCDAFRKNTEYQFMTGGQFVAHPGNIQPAYDINIVDRDHPITRGLDDFTMRDTEQYYMHVDPCNHVLATTTFRNWHDVVMPAVWTRMWGDGRVAFASFGHTYRDFDIPEAREIVSRVILWSAGAL